MKLPKSIVDKSKVMSKRTATQGESEFDKQITLYLPDMRLVNELNSREHWSRRSARAKDQRERIYFNLIAMQKVPLLPVQVTFVRHGPQFLDDDGLVASFKHVRDGIADAYGVEDNDPRIDWEKPTQEKGEYGVVVTIHRIKANR